ARLDQAAKLFCQGWGGQQHREMMSRRQEAEKADPEFAFDGAMLDGSPFDHEAWEGLAELVEHFVQALPDEVRGWASLGRAFAHGIRPQPTEAHVRAAQVIVENALSGVRDAPLLAGTDLRVCWESQSVFDLHECFLDRLSGGAAPEAARQDAAG